MQEFGNDVLDFLRERDFTARERQLSCEERSAVWGAWVKYRDLMERRSLGENVDAEFRKRTRDASRLGRVLIEISSVGVGRKRRAPVVGVGDEEVGGLEDALWTKLCCRLRFECSMLHDYG